MIVEYEIKNVGKTADDLREEIIKVVGMDCFVEVHPQLVRVHFAGKLDENKLKALDKLMAEEADGERIRYG